MVFRTHIKLILASHRGIFAKTRGSEMRSQKIERENRGGFDSLAIFDKKGENQKRMAASVGHHTVTP